MASYRVAVDIGGTFTDFVVFDEETSSLVVGKAPSTPGDLSAAVFSGLHSVLPDLSDVEFFVHGTTAGLNALLERRGARTALITTEGFRDVYEIGRGNRPDMYNIHYRRPRRLVPRRHVYEVQERIRFDGTVQTPISRRSVESVLDAIAEEQFTSVAICLLHAYVNPDHEIQVERWLRERFPHLSISCSHRVAPEWREFERTSTTVLDAYVAPVMDSYLSALEQRARDDGLRPRIFIMQSTGGLVSSGAAKQMSVQTLMSGPVGGTIGGTALAAEVGFPNLLCADMGGTSFDLTLIIDGRPDVATEAELDGFPLLAPMVDIHTIGAGGGSIAWLEGGGLRVGPRSAGADPGPACYGRGGTEPTVTDANLVLGRIDPGHFMGGQMTLDIERARAALAGLADQLDLTPVELAEGMCRVVNANMAGTIRELTVQRGIDPRDFYLVAFGGAGPVHAAFIAQELGIPAVIVPRAPGAFSAWGMLQTDLRRDSVRSFRADLNNLDQAQVQQAFGEMEAAARQSLVDDGITADVIEFHRSLDLRYVGQEHFLNLDIQAAPGLLDSDEIARQFHNAHAERYGHHNPDEDIEVVNLRLAAIGHVPQARLGPTEKPEGHVAAPISRRKVQFDGREYETPVYVRTQLLPDDAIDGPAIVEEDSCTTVVPPDHTLVVDAYSNLVIRPAAIQSRSNVEA